MFFIFALIFVMQLSGVVAAQTRPVVKKKPAATKAPSKSMRTRVSPEALRSKDSPYQTLAGGQAGPWGPWEAHHGYRGIQMRARLQKDMQPKGQPFYRWEIEFKNNYNDLVSLWPFTGDKNKFVNPRVAEPYDDGSRIDVAPGKINSSSGFVGTKTEVKVYLSLIFAKSPRYEMGQGSGQKFALYDSGGLPDYCVVYNVWTCPNFKEDEKNDDKEVKPKNPETVSTKTTVSTAPVDLKGKILENLRKHTIQGDVVDPRRGVTGNYSGLKVEERNDLVEISFILAERSPRLGNFRWQQYWISFNLKTVNFSIGDTRLDYSILTPDSGACKQKTRLDDGSFIDGNCWDVLPYRRGNNSENFSEIVELLRQYRSQ